jgi:hypothetical protein
VDIDIGLAAGGPDAMSAAEPVQRPGEDRLAVGLTPAFLHMV